VKLIPRCLDCPPCASVDGETFHASGSEKWSSVMTPWAARSSMCRRTEVWGNGNGWRGLFASIGQSIAQGPYLGRNDRQMEGSLAGAAMFVTAQKELGWGAPQLM